MVSISITEKMLLTVLGNFVVKLVDCEVVRGQANRVSPPKGEFIVLTPLSALSLSTTIETHEPNLQADTLRHMRPTQWTAQIDCYGKRAQDRAVTLSTLLRSAYACEQFGGEGLNVQPLFAGDARQLPFVNASDQYEERWSFDAVLQYNPVIIVPQDFANALSASLIEVDTKFPPGV
ncbi:MAG: hypothetical protein VB141_10915 [Burkholderia gladioli]